MIKGTYGVEKLEQLDLPSGVGYYLAGGCIRTIWDNTEIKDLDIFLMDLRDKDRVIAHYEGLGYEVIFRCPEGKLTTLRKFGRPKVQIISEFQYKNPRMLIESFDLLASRFAYDGEFIYYFISSAKSALRKETTLGVITYPMATFKRLIKYSEKGYKITNDSIESFVEQVSKMGYVDGRFYID